MQEPPLDSDPGSGNGGRSARRPTMADVAGRAGVSRALVSLVLRDRPGPSSETRRRVLDAARELHYRPNNAAQLLARTRSRVLGVLLAVGDPFHAELIEAVYPVADEYGYDLLLSAYVASRDERAIMEALLGHRCEALVLFGPRFEPRHIDELNRAVPTVVVGPRPRGTGVDAVHTAVGKGVRQAMDHLVALGHREIVHVDGGTRAGATQRRTAYRAAMRRHGLEGRSRIIPGDYSEESGVRAARQLLDEGRLPDAIVAANDRCAIGMLDVLVRSGVDVPGDVSIVGYDDAPSARLPHIDLTTIRQDTGRLGRLAIEVAVDRLERPDASRREVVLEPTLLVRGTTGPRRRNAR